MPQSPELRLEEEIFGQPLIVESSDMRIFSLLMADPNPLHFDPSAVLARGMGDRVINQGTLNVAYVINIVLELVRGPAQLKSFRCRFLANVFEGETVGARGRVSAIERETATVELWLERGNGERVLEGSATITLEKQ